MLDEIVNLFSSVKDAANAISSWWSGLTSSEKASWIQAAGSLVGLGIAIAVPWRLASRTERARARSKALLIAPPLFESVGKVRRMDDAVPANGPNAGVIPRSFSVPDDLEPKRLVSVDFDNEYLKAGISAHSDGLHDLGPAAKSVQRYVRLLLEFADELDAYSYRVRVQYADKEVTEDLRKQAKASEPVLVKKLRRLRKVGEAASRKVGRL